MVAVCAAATATACTPAPAPPSPLLHDDHAVRANGWTLWERLSAGPAWERWFRSDVVFSDAPLVASDELVFRAPHAITEGGKLVESAMEHQLYFVVLDPTAAQHVRANHLNHKQRAKIPDFPTDAVALKLVWYPVHGKTEVPVWDGTPTRADADGNPPSTWTRTVTVTPDGADGTVPIDRFYHRRLATDREVAAARVAWHDSAIALGDEVVLVAIHATTKQIPDWTWETYWWTDRGGGDPALTGWAASYTMSATVTPGQPCMNPWLEAKFPGGVGSNCIDCHRRAAWGAKEFLPIVADLPPPLASTDFMWSVAFEAK